MKTERCFFYPKPQEETCVCGAGADVSGIDNEYICSEEYADNTCPYYREEIRSLFKNDLDKKTLDKQ